MPERLFVGATVQYCPADLQHDRQQWHAAFVTRVHHPLNTGLVDLIVVFSDAERGTVRRLVRPSTGTTAGWRWPPFPSP